jgi:hypothetical protein
LTIVDCGSSIGDRRIVDCRSSIDGPAIGRFESTIDDWRFESAIAEPAIDDQQSAIR